MNFKYQGWWKIVGSLLVAYTLVAGFLFKVPALPILHETIRNLYFHVPMWFAMVVLFGISIYMSIKYLLTNNIKYDIQAEESVKTGLIFAIIGLITGSIWAKHTWGQYWSFDVKQNYAAISTLLYFAYLVLRGSVDEEQKRAKLTAIYNIFAFPLMVLLLFVLPRLGDSLHPGNGGNPGFNSYDLDSKMRMVFYPACMGWIFISYWIFSIRVRTKFIKYKQEEIN